MAKKKGSNKIPLPIFIIVCAVLLFAIYTSLSTLVLAIWGDTVIGTVDSYGSRVDDSKAEPKRSRTISKGYWFLVKGKEYRGYVMYNSDEAWPSLRDDETRSERIRYLPFFPYINKPAMLSDFDEMGEVAVIYHIIAPIACLLLLLLIIRTSRGRKKKKTVARKPAAPRAAQAKRDTNIFCPHCGSKLPEDAAFCADCGAEILADAPGFCSDCGAVLPDDAEFCIECGKPVNPSGTKRGRDEGPGRIR